jgi:aldehyde:ferredoxin oxidoreductase
MGLAYATSNRGACHLRGYTVASEVLGIPVKTDPLNRRRQARTGEGLPGCHRRVRLAGICIFTSFAWGLADVAPQVQGACGGGVHAGELAKIGERIWNMERDFNNRAGFTAKDD